MSDFRITSAADFSATTIEPVTEAGRTDVIVRIGTGQKLHRAPQQSAGGGYNVVFCNGTGWAKRSSYASLSRFVDNVTEETLETHKNKLCKKCFKDFS